MTLTSRQTAMTATSEAMGLMTARRLRLGGLMSLRVRVARLTLVAGVLAAAPLVLPAIASAESCPNEEIRAEQGSERLPDCRAFELVTPEVKGDNGSIGAAEGSPYVFPDGNHVFYSSLLPMPGAQSGSFEGQLSTRTASGWVNISLAPPSIGQGEPIGLISGPANNTLTQVAFTGDFSAAFLNSPFDTDPQDQDGAVDPYRVDLSSGAWSLAAFPDSGPMTKSLDNVEPEPSFNDGVFIAGVSQNGSHVFFETMDQLPVAPGQPGEPHVSNMLYDRTGGHTYAVGVLPDGKVVPTCDVEVGDGAKNITFQGEFNYGAISPDGSNVVFTTNATPSEACASPGVYLREHNATTVQLAGQSYIARSSDGSKVFTANGGDNQGERDNGIYEYDVANGTTTVVTTQGQFVASSADGSRVYYLTGSGLYVWDNGTSTLIPNAGEGFFSRVKGAGNEESSEPNYAVATPDGSKLLFLDTASLTGYNNYGPGCTEGRPGYCSEAYVYNAVTGSITCVSCNPTGAPPAGVVQTGASLGETNLMGGEQKNTLLPPYSEGEISPDGSRVFFESDDALVPQDTNGISDVYEWENGRIYLISSGQGTYGSTFAGASRDGHDAIIATTDHLAPQSIESSTAFYDVRVDGGFPYKPFSTGCDSGQCQGPQTSAPGFGPPASATFVGLGNPVAAAVAPTVKAKAKPKRKPKSKRRSRARKTVARPGGINGKRKGRK